MIERRDLETDEGRNGQDAPEGELPRIRPTTVFSVADIMLDRVSPQRIDSWP